jgi:hypothetical protein
LDWKRTCILIDHAAYNMRVQTDATNLPGIPDCVRVEKNAEQKVRAVVGVVKTSFKHNINDLINTRCQVNSALDSNQISLRVLLLCASNQSI